MKKALTTLALSLVTTGFALAQTNISIGIGGSQGQVNGGALLSLLALAQTLVTRLVPFAVGIAVLAFFWFLIQFIFQSSDPTKKKATLEGMGYSILALFVMVSIWGIVGLLGSMLGIGQGGNVPIPGVPNPA